MREFNKRIWPHRVYVKRQDAGDICKFYTWIEKQELSKDDAFIVPYYTSGEQQGYVAFKDEKIAMWFKMIYDMGKYG